MRVCEVDSCERKHRRNGLCNAHSYRVARGQAVDTPIHQYGAKGSASPFWKGDAAGYKAVHLRLTKERGRAKDQVCVECEGQATDWAFDEPTGYSTDLTRYRPLCASCHKVADHGNWR